VQKKYFVLFQTNSLATYKVKVFENYFTHFCASQVQGPIDRYAQKKNQILNFLLFAIEMLVLNVFDQKKKT